MRARKEGATTMRLSRRRAGSAKRVRWRRQTKSVRLGRQVAGGLQLLLDRIHDATRDRTIELTVAHRHHDDARGAHVERLQFRADLPLRKRAADDDFFLGLV